MDGGADGEHRLQELVCGQRCGLPAGEKPCRNSSSASDGRRRLSGARRRPSGAVCASVTAIRAGRDLALPGAPVADLADRSGREQGTHAHAQRFRPSRSAGDRIHVSSERLGRPGNSTPGGPAGQLMVRYGLVVEPAAVNQVEPGFWGCPVPT